MDLRRSSLIVKYSSLSFLTKSSRKYSSSSSPAMTMIPIFQRRQRTTDYTSLTTTTDLSLSIC